MSIKRASNICCLNLTSNPPSIIYVSLKADLTDFGLPGGKVDPDETYEEAAVREMMEETGVQININDSCKVIEDGIDDHGYHVKTFLVTDFDYDQELKSEEEAVIKWGPVEDLLKSVKYKKHNEKCYRILKDMYKF